MAEGIIGTEGEQDEGGRVLDLGKLLIMRFDLLLRYALWVKNKY